MSTGTIEYTEGEGLNIASHVFTEDGVTKHMERISPGAGITGAADDTATVTAVGLVADFSCACAGKGRLIVSAKAVTGNTDFCTFRLVFKNSAGDVLGTSPLVQSTFTELTSGGSPDYRYGTVTAFANDCGASSVEVYLVSLPSSASVVLSLVAV